MIKRSIHNHIEPTSRHSRLLTGLFDENIWYKEMDVSFDNDNHTFPYEFSPSKTAVQQNIYELARSANPQSGAGCGETDKGPE
ncbi:hypothetical protein [Bacillus sp. V59.32b]|uniref:hypothetical protein n=1 Tax=Bacillus sp. V59.32b TaxID=1758642 RepID=UPI000E3BA21A|nr:hypothetical protein [Bacillus sp. V59.32b]RFU62543.1 hypothetical protein D0463_13365 [Bacillus sp. V59.32b]